MIVFVDRIIVKDETLMRDIVHALENNPQSCYSYDIRMIERHKESDPIKKASGVGEWEINIGRHEKV